MKYLLERADVGCGVSRTLLDKVERPIPGLKVKQSLPEGSEEGCPVIAVRAAGPPPGFARAMLPSPRHCFTPRIVPRRSYRSAPTLYEWRTKQYKIVMMIPGSLRNRTNKPEKPVDDVLHTVETETFGASEERTFTACAE